MATQELSPEKTEYSKKIKTLLKSEKCQISEDNKTAVLNAITKYDTQKEISLTSYKRLLCFLESSCDKKWNRECGNISNFKKSKRDPKCIVKPLVKLLVKPFVNRPLNLVANQTKKSCKANLVLVLIYSAQIN